MLNPLNIAPASGQIANQATSQATDPKPDPLASLKSETSEAKRRDKTFESVLAAESDAADAAADPAADAAKDTTAPDVQTDVDPELDTDEAETDEASADEVGTDEAAEFPILADHANAPPQADEGRLPPGQDQFHPNDFAGSDSQAGHEGGRIFSQVPPNTATPDTATVNRTSVDRASGDPVIAMPGNAGSLLTAAQSPQFQNGPALQNGPAPQNGPALGATNQPVLTGEITAGLPQVSTGPQAATDDKSHAKGGRAVHSLLGVALGQQASAAIAGQNEVQKKPQVATPVMPADTDQALPDKAVDVLSNPVSPTATAAGTGQTDLALQALAEGGRTYKDSDKITKRQKDNPRISDLNLATRSGQILPAPSGVIAATAAGPVPAPGPVPATFAEFQMDTGRVNWVSETGVLADTGARSGVPAPATTSINQVFNHPGLPRHLAAQIASVAQRGGADKPVELLLNPSELGRVKISMTSNDGRMSVSVIADRPETLDLMRRHIDVLAQEFLDIGYGQADFAFGQNSPQSGADSAPYTPDDSSQIPGPASDAAPETPPLANIINATGLITDRVDIRL